MSTVLLIDSASPHQAGLARQFTQAGWKIITAKDGSEAIAMAVEHRVNAVVCHLSALNANGFQICRTLRERHGELPGTAVVLAADEERPTARLNSQAVGATDFWVLPIPSQVFAERLQTLVAGTADEHTGNYVRFWGVRGSIPTPGPTTAYYGGNTSCVEVRGDGELIVLDAGSGIRPLGLSLISEYGARPVSMTLLLSHTHWDHIQGFPFFAPGYNQINRLRVLGYEGSRQGLETTLIGQMESSYFPIGMKQMGSHVRVEEINNMTFQIGAVQVASTFVNHPGICVAFRVQTSTGSVAYIPDHEPFERMRLMQSRAQEVNKELIEFARSEDRKIIEFIRGADVLIIDSQYDQAEYEEHVGWGHSCVDDSIALGLNGGVKRLFLTHHDPGHDDAWVSRSVERARALVREKNSPMLVEAAREGLIVPLNH
jgi:phosphoribosyl 1,2-cyclic phosphodiesterase/CheY-like chemotaxis protein